MILRRVIEHFRKQEWTAVAIDFVIVVLGVFVGIQVANWNEARKDAAAEAALLSRLEEEFRALAAPVEDLVAFTRSTQESTAAVVNALRSPTPPADEPGFRAALGRANWLESVPPISATYQELVSTGRLTEISDAALRNALTRYGDAHQRLERIYPEAMGVIFEPGSNYYRAVDWNMDAATWKSEGAIVSYDWEALRASRAEMQGWIAFQFDLALYAGKELEEIRLILALLEERGE